jgi:pyruvate/2-oxoglutarate dehydrogenase complex dihydrolipoamide dehydrogenase (E3) component
MAISERYDAIVIGSGEAGKYLAWHLAGKGQRVVVVERAYIGGSCPNIACLPSKNLLHSAAVIQTVRDGAAYGAETDQLRINAHTILERKRQMVQGLVQLHLDKFKANGVQLLLGEATFVAPLTVQVAGADGETVTLTAEKLFLNTGSKAALPEIAGLREARPWTHVEALEFDIVPEHLVVLGGGYVGIELAQAFRRFGSHVTILHRGPRLLEQGDEDVSAALTGLLEDEGIEVLTEVNVDAVQGRSGAEVVLHLAERQGVRQIVATHLLVTTGRVASTASLNLAAGGVQTGANGYIAVDEHLRTSAANVWAMGDCTGGAMFTHVSYDDFRVVRDQLSGRDRTAKDRLIPSTLFTEPELAHVGLSERDAQAQRVQYRRLLMPMAGVLRTRTTGQTRGFWKALIAADDRILGFTAFGASAGETLAVVQMAMLGKMPYTAIADAIFTHPTLAEGLVFFFSGQPQPAS